MPRKRKYKKRPSRKKKKRKRRMPEDKIKYVKTPKGYTPVAAYPSVKPGYTAVYFERKRKK